MDQEPLAMELIKELKATSRRWFICFCVMVALEVATIFGFIWYVSLPTDVSTEVQQDTEGSGSNTYVGGDNSGTTNN